MSAASEMALNGALAAALTARTQRVTAEMGERGATIRFMREAKRNHWSWDMIGKALSISATAARRYFERNDHKVTVR